MTPDPMREFIEMLHQLQRDLADADQPAPRRRIGLYREHLQWLLGRCQDADLAERARLAAMEVDGQEPSTAALAGLRAICARLARTDAVARERERTVMGEHVDVLLLQAQRMHEAEEIEQTVGRAIARLDAEPVGELERMHAASDLLEMAIATALRER